MHFYDFVEALRRDKHLTTTLDINRYTMGVGEKLSQLLFNEQGRIVADTFPDRYNDEFHEHSNPTQARSDLRVRPISFRIMAQGSKVLYKSYVVPDSVPQDAGNNG